MGVMVSPRNGREANTGMHSWISPPESLYTYIFLYLIAIPSQEN